ncbi:MAG TPA: glycerate kinase, partial [Ktedonobacteraceae bacterium]|nr:glycerate kinase [Ktedonobacteraceae bacterium]
MKILIAPSAYKGYFSPTQVALAMQAGVEEFMRWRRQGSEGGKQTHPDVTEQIEVTLAPIADGGDGTIESIHQARGGALHQLTVPGPLGETVEAQWLVLEGDRGNAEDDNFFYMQVGPDAPALMYRELAVVELASACGIAYLKGDQLRALDANTEGAGEVLKKSLENGSRNIVMTVGGSASTDGGMGILSRLGARFLDSHGKPLTPCGRNLNQIRQIDLSGLRKLTGNLRLRVATDVENVLLGDRGAAAIF